MYKKREKEITPLCRKSAAKPYFSAGVYQILMKISKNVHLDGILPYAKNQHRFRSSFWS